MCSVRPMELTASKLRLGDLAVVQVAHLGQLAQPPVDDRLLGPLGLLAGQRHAQRLHPVALGGVHDHPAPAAADVQQPHPRLQPELAGHPLVLGLLGELQGGVRRGEHRAGVGHRRPEQPLVEPVRHVVVVRDRRAVAGQGVQPPPRPGLLGRQRHPVPQPEAEELAGDGRLLGPGDPVQRGVGQGPQGRVERAADLELAGDVGPGQPERARCRGEVGQRPRRPHVDRDLGVRRPRRAAVVGRQPDRRVTHGPVEDVSNQHPTHPTRVTCRVRTCRRGPAAAPRRRTAA